jgi:hypothetical protein
MEEKNLPAIRPNKKPWWYYGLMVIVFAQMLFYVKFKIASFAFIMLVINVMLFAAIFVREFIKQRAQYTIRSLLILTFCVAVMCSVYLYTGIKVVGMIINILILAAFFISIYYEPTRNKMD